MSKRMKWVISTLIILLVFSAGLIYFVYASYLSSRRELADRALPTLWMEENGIKVRWPVLDADLYYVEICDYPDGEKGEKNVLYSEFIEDAVSCTLPELPSDQELTLQIFPVKTYTFGGKEKYRVIPAQIIRRFYNKPPTVTDLEWTANPENGTLSVRYILDAGDCCDIFVWEKGEIKYLKTGGEDGTALTFGEAQELELPQYDSPCSLLFAACSRYGDMVVYGYKTEELTVEREDFLQRDLNLKLTDMGSGVCSLTWDETKGEHYEIQLQQDDSNDWETIEKVSRGEERFYVSSRLMPFVQYKFRVVAVGGQTMDDSSYAAISEECGYEAGCTPIYCTIWTTKSLPAYRDAEKSEETGRTGVLEAYCVVEETDGMFGIYMDGALCYVDSNYCMINLPEYLGSLCNYDITNSYSSLYMAHDYEIPDVTGVVTGGYEHVRMADGSFLVPLLYPTAQKLETAARNALTQGYRLKIYDSYRPHKASVEIHSLAKLVVDEQIPEETYTGKVFEDLDIYVHEEAAENPADAEGSEGKAGTSADGENAESAAENTAGGEGTEDTSVNKAMKDTISGNDEAGENGEEGEEGLPRITYWQLMNGGHSFTLSNFLAAGVSRHNLGVAMDLTLEEMPSQTELEMQTPMHDLSWYSAPTENNDNAKLLASIMTAAGYRGIHSEWWHFQDDESKERLSPAVMNDGVTPECWMTDGYGWRYRLIDGTYAADCKLTIDGTEYTFDTHGYVE